MNRRERRGAARKSQPVSMSVGAGTPAALHEAGRNFLRLGQPLDAQLCCQQALAADPDYADALHLMGLVSLQAKQYDHGLKWFGRAIKKDAKPE